jgi:hypothetical protein
LGTTGLGEDMAVAVAIFATSVYIALWILIPSQISCFRSLEKLKRLSIWSTGIFKVR